MPFPANVLGILFALTSALVWGGGDFSGGLATRRNSQFQVLALSALSGIVLLLVFAAARQEAFPSLPSSIWAMLAGACGAVGIAALYRALSIGYAASVAPTAAVIGAALPVGFSNVVEGMPDTTRMTGFVLALLGIWLVSRPSHLAGSVSRQGFLLACLAGLGFGGFFILIAQVEPSRLFTPLVIARSVTFSTALLLLRVYRLPLHALTDNPIALLAGLLDAGGNVFYLLAKQYTRLDVAAVLASLYPVTTVLLAGLILKERVSGGQWIGVGICFAAIVLITI